MPAFACLRCRAVLTRDLDEVPVTELSKPVAPYRASGDRARPALVARGRFAVDPDRFGPPHVPSPGNERVLVSAGPRHSIMIHPDDLLVRRLHPDPDRLNGCCALDGCDGPNLVCACGAEIATEQSDCWTSPVVRLHPPAVAEAP